ncbi:MAG: ABC transporter ATP-binding protein [Candidatus Sericytochromatia bacterium]
MQSMIEASGLVRSFGAQRALDGVSLAVGAGEVFGVLGPNGAGKTTTVRVLNGLLAPEAGTARVAGFDPMREGDAVRRQTGVLTETPALYESLSGRDNLRFFGAMHRMEGARLESRIEASLAEVGLTDRAGDKAGGYSKGMKQRLALARALLHEPPVLFLDEPTSGLDPESSEAVNQLIRGLGQAGRTVFMCTHLLNEAERICHRFALFAQGRVLATGTKAELERLVGARPTVRLRFDGAPPPLPALAGASAPLVEGRTLTLTVEEEAVIPGVVAAAVEAGGRILAVEPLAPTLEALYFALIRDGREGGAA